MMKKVIGLFGALAISTVVFAAHAGEMELPLKMLVGTPPAGKAVVGKALSMQNGIELIDIILKSKDVAATREAISVGGGSARSTLGEIMTASAPVGFLTELAARREVVSVEASKQLNLLMDSARANTGASSVQDGSADGTAWDGKYVVVGAIDSGLDYSRADFNGAEDATRVQYLGFQAASGGSMQAECYRCNITEDSCSIATTNDESAGHGSHVMGIAAGSDAGYKGMAPAADIILIANNFSDDVNEGQGTFSGSVLDAASSIFDKAASMDKPAVINLSQGTHIGAHDNTSLMEQGLNSAMTGGKGYGRAMTVSAGNESIVDATIGTLATYAGGIHAPISVPAGSSYAWRLWIIDEPTRTPLLVDAWFGSGEGANCSVSAKAYNISKALSTSLTTDSALAAEADLPLSTDNSGTEVSTSDNKATFRIAVVASVPNNSLPRAIVLFGPGSSGAWSDIIYTDTSSGMFMDVVVRAGAGGSCSGNMWIEGGGTRANFMKAIDTITVGAGGGTKGAAYTMQNGDGNKIVVIPATASGVIAVGAYLQPKPTGSAGSVWTGISGSTYDATDVNEPTAAQVNGGTVNSRSPFSSIGPPAYTYSGRKPDVLAPGDPVISVLPSGHSVASALQVNDTHYKSQGTSQASPMVAGIVALLFQKNNRLTAAEVKEVLITTASGAASPNDSDGYGRVQAVGAINAISADGSGFAGTGDLSGGTCGGGGSSGCGGSTLLPVAPSTSALAALLVILPALLVAARRKR